MNDRPFREWDEFHAAHAPETMPWFCADIGPDLGRALVFEVLSIERTVYHGTFEPPARTLFCRLRRRV
jgi:hypothetical protein